MIKMPIDTTKNDTIEECKKCGRRIHLRFANGMKNGWDVCCGQTMTLVKCPKTFKAINEAVKEYLDINEWQIAEIKQAIEEADKPGAKFIDHEKVKAKWGAKRAHSLDSKGR